MDGLIKNIEELPESLQEAIRRGIRTQIISEADFYKEECETELLAYLDAEIKRADNIMKKMHQDSTKVGAELFGISKTYVWNKEKKKALINYKNDYLMQLQANGCKSKQMDAKEPQQKELLKDDGVLEIFLKAIDANLISKKSNNFVWNSTKQLLAYFAERISDKFSLSSKLDKDGKKTTNWKTFETIFNVTGLSGAKQNWMRLNVKFEPTGFEKVDALF